MQTIHASELANVTGGADIGGVAQGDDGKSNFAMSNPPKGTQFWENSPKGGMAADVQKYNNFYDKYTGMIDTLNGIGGGRAVMKGAKPSKVGF